mgnify:CR=1 FL=1
MQKSEKKRVCMKPVCERMAQVTPIIFHIDVNSAYLSWTAVEQLKNGAKVDIREIPAIIGGDQNPGTVLFSQNPLLPKNMASARENLLRMPFVSVRIS